MRANWTKWALWLVGLVLVVAGGVWFAWPQPIPVDLAIIVRAPMEITVDDEAKTRVRDVYTVSAPIAGTVLRTPRRVGDQVTADETIVAVMQPPPPSFHDVRTHEELQAAAAAADAAVTFAESEVRRIEAALEFSRSELRRAEALAGSNTISTRALDEARLNAETNEAALASAKAQLEVRRSERASAAARLLNPSGVASTADPTCCIELRSPVTGRVLKTLQESEAVVPAGAPLIAIGDPLDLEVVADLLSIEAVRIETGSPVRIEGWGGPPVRGQVTRIDPAGFTKVSALGIEEQRVRTIIDFVDPPEAWSRLGDDFRVIVNITVWSAENVLIVPVAALFRSGNDWAVFVLRDGRARITPVEIGHRNSEAAEVLSGLAAGDPVVLHPSDRIADRTRISERGTVESRE
jgi:HlyD family secretion protein